MAEKLKDDNWRADHNTGTYPWNKWLDGDTWRIFHGQDYTCSNLSMDRAIRSAARKRGMRATIQRNVEGQVTLRAFIPEAKPVNDELGKFRKRKVL